MALSYAPDPDLFIRTGGELRISNFLLWQVAYSELVLHRLPVAGLRRRRARRGAGRVRAAASAASADVEQPPEPRGAARAEAPDACSSSASSPPSVLLALLLPALFCAVGLAVRRADAGC